MRLSVLFQVRAEGGDGVPCNGVKGDETVDTGAGMARRARLLVASGVGSEGR